LKLIGDHGGKNRVWKPTRRGVSANGSNINIKILFFEGLRKLEGLLFFEVASIRESSEDWVLKEMGFEAIAFSGNDHVRDPGLRKLNKV
jgi:hypothetical protein